MFFIFPQKCAICKKNILEDFENIWDHDCYRALDQNLYTFLLNSDNEFEPGICFCLFLNRIVSLKEIL